MKLLDGIWEIAVQLSVHNVYRYGGYCCMCHDENIEIGFKIIHTFHVNYNLTFLSKRSIFTKSRFVKWISAGVHC